MTEVRVVKLTKRYGRIIALDNVSIDIHDGEYVAIIGPSGCGKTTFIKCLAGIVTPSEGEILFDGRPMNALTPEEHEIGYVFQEIALFPHMDIWDNITYGPRVRGMPDDRVRRTGRELTELIKMTAREDAMPKELSGGARQKAGVARALATGSNLIFFDEPLGALDAKVRVELRYEIRNLVRDLGLTAIHITHDQQEALSIADRIIVMKSGRFVEIGTPSELYTRPKTIFAANFVGETNFMIGEVVKKTGRVAVVNCGRGIFLESSETFPHEGEKVVAAIRPEFVTMMKKADGGGIQGFVENQDFEGSTLHYEITIPDHRPFAVRVPRYVGSPSFEVGEEVYLRTAAERVLLYPYPKEGFENELDTESR